MKKSQGSKEKRENAAIQLADLAKTYKWEEALNLLSQYPELINSTRPNGKSLYTPLPQAAHGNAPISVLEALISLGASPLAQNSKLQRPIEMAQSRGHNRLVSFFEELQAKYQRNPNLYFNSRVINAQLTCALRFRGYDYEKSISDSHEQETTGHKLSKLIRPIVESLVLNLSISDNFAAYFGLQRFLHKWGGEYLTKESKEHIAYDFLFLHLYSVEPPEEFCDAKYCSQWIDEFQGDIEYIAANVRQAYHRRVVSH